MPCCGRLRDARRGRAGSTSQTRQQRAVSGRIAWGDGAMQPYGGACSHPGPAPIGTQRVGATMGANSGLGAMPREQ